MDISLLENISINNQYDAFWARYNRNKNKRIIIFGCGDQGMMAAALLQENGMPVWSFCDNNEFLHGKLVKGIKVISPNDLVEIDDGYIVINNDSYRKEKREQLLSLGVKDEDIYSFDVFNPLFKGMTRSYVEKHKQEFCKVYDFLADDFSKKTFIDYLHGVYTGDLECYEDTVCKEEYFPKDIVEQVENHVFLDVGAYNGNTIETFIQFAREYKKIYAFEPFASSAEIIRKKKFTNTEVITAAASDYTGKKDFYCNNYGAMTMVTTILEEGAKHEKVTLVTVAIDDVVKDDKVTFIKMDIEGSELEALHGAEQTIKKNKPFLAICVYHKKEDLISILPYIKSIVPEYKMYLRHHANSAVDLVLYCKLEGE